MKCLKNVDWELLNKQKLALFELISGGMFYGEEQQEDMDGILNFLDELTDEHYHNNKLG